MNKIEDILDSLLKEFPEMIEQKNSIRKLLISMEKNNPEINIDSDFKQALKNKLEVQNYAKLKNTQNKKINIAEWWTLSFKKDNKSIFKKPSLNFIKILSPIFAWAFALFGFFHFFWDNLFDIESGGELEYNTEKITIPISPAGSEEEINQWDKKNTQEIIVNKEQIINAWERVTTSQSETKETKTIITKMTIAERIAKRNILNKAKNTKKKLQEEDDFTKAIIWEMWVKQKVEEPKEQKPIKSPLPTSPQERGIEQDKLINATPSIPEWPTVNSEIKTDNIQNTEIIDILWDENALEWSIEWNEWMSFSDASMVSDEIINEENWSDVEQNVPEWDYIEQDLFQKFCDEKKWIIKNNICNYWELQCSQEDFINKKCK